jgi:hypothetical protein
MIDLKQVKPAPTFKGPDAPGTGHIYGSGGDDFGGARYCQHGHYFGGDGRYIGTDPKAKNTGVSKAVKDETVDQGAKVVTLDELDDLMKHPRADELMSMPLDSLANLVAAAGGPSYSGDQAHRLYTGWLLKHTNVDA